MPIIMPVSVSLFLKSLQSCGEFILFLL